MHKTMFQFKPLTFKSKNEADSAQSSPKDCTTGSTLSSSPFEWMTRRKKSLSLSFSDHNSTSSNLSSPVLQSPVKVIVNVIEEFKRDLEHALRLRDVFILEEDNGFTILQDSHVWTLNHISVVQNLVRLRSNEDGDPYAGKERAHLSAESTKDCDSWKPRKEDKLTKWTLDSTEGPCRMRKRMMRDKTFYIRYPHLLNHDQVTLKRFVSGEDSYEYSRRVNKLSPYYNPYRDVEKETKDPEHHTTHNKASFTNPDALVGQEEIRTATTLCSHCHTLQLCSQVTEKDQRFVCSICARTLNSTKNGILCNGILQRNQLTEEHDTLGNVDNTKKVDIMSSGLTNAENIDLVSQNIAPPTPDSVPDPSLSSAAYSSASELQSIPSEKASVPSIAKSSVSTKATPVSDANNHVDANSASADPDTEEQNQNNQTILKILEKGEKIKNMFRCGRVQGLDVHEGLLLFGLAHYFIIDGFTMLKNREICDISTLSDDFEPIVPSCSSATDIDKDMAIFRGRVCSKFSYSAIREVHKRRYLLQNTALEVFNKDGRNSLLVFSLGTRMKVFNRFLSNATMLSDGGRDFVSGQRPGLNVEPLASAILSPLIGERTVTNRWENGEISNFQYLMHLNTLAGRSYNDLMQYPVFPWILTDYDSEDLDLTKPETFRDLSKPMGALTPARLEQYLSRYEDWQNLGGIVTAPYLYCTHYSSAMIVASFLIRMEPFTQSFLRLQGGHFDLADRMFHSIKDSWESASAKNMADVKELIPEFFYSPEFLVNSNQFDLGQKQNGVQLNDVVLPPWARGSPYEFIRAHREALESDYVSSHLHEWIDLIFGYKQKGDAALEAHNVFNHLFYEGGVDISSIAEPLMRKAVIGFINNVGQVPAQLFKRPHPQKKAKKDATKVFYRHLKELKTLDPIKELDNPVAFIFCHERGVWVTEKGATLIPPLFTRHISWNHEDKSVRVGYYESERPMQIFENLSCDEITCATMATENLLLTGDRSSVVHVWNVPSAKDRNKTMTLVKRLHGHHKAVVSIVACAAYGIVVSGSNDGSCILWDLNHLAYVRELHHGTDASVSNIYINEKTGMIVTSSLNKLFLWSINGQLMVSVDTLGLDSCQKEVTCLSMTQLNEWDAERVIISGHADGYVCFWRLEHKKRLYSNSDSSDLYIRSGNNVVFSFSSNQTIQNVESHNSSQDDVFESTDDVTSNSMNENTRKLLKHKGLSWKQELVLKGRIRLPFGNDACPAVTCIAMSKSHDRLLVGDAKGRVFSWSCTS